jgi:sugar-specific transcriptional regulator TrmB
MKYSSSLPFAFTKQGVAMLSGILNSKKATEVNIQIMRAFIAMKRFISSNISISNRLEHIEQKTIEYDSNFKKIFAAIDSKENKLKDQGIFFNGEIFDSYKFVVDLLKSAKKNIVLIDNYIDESILTLFTKINKKIKVKIYTSINNKIKLDVSKYNLQYNNIELIDFKKSHDRFLIIDNKEIYHIGASLKDLGKKWFAFSKIDFDINLVLNKLKI